MDDNRRRCPRFPFYAAAKITEIQSGVPLTTRTSELSRYGCYMDTMNPFPIATPVKMELLYDDEAINLDGTIIYSQPNMGMGVVFAEVTETAESILGRWLNHLREINPAIA
jgi:hypothetical protein